MNKQEFLEQLRSRLSGVPAGDVDERLDFYSEMIDDSIEEGLSEEEAVSQVGTVNDVARQIIGEIPLSKIVKENVKPKRRLRAWEIVLLVLGSPVWVSLLIAAVSVVLSLYISLWAVIISFWAVFLALAVSAVYSVISGVVCLVMGYGFVGLAMFGAALCCAGLAIFAFFGCKAASKGTVKLTKFIALKIKSLFIRKGENNE